MELIPRTFHRPPLTVHDWVRDATPAQAVAKMRVLGAGGVYPQTLNERTRRRAARNRSSESDQVRAAPSQPCGHRTPVPRAGLWPGRDGRRTRRGRGHAKPDSHNHKHSALSIRTVLIKRKPFERFTNFTEFRDGNAS